MTKGTAEQRQVTEVHAAAAVHIALRAWPLYIVSDKGGLPEIARNGPSGIVCEDEADFENAVLRLSRDSTFHRTLSDNALAAYRSCYTPDAHVARYLEHVNSLG